MVKDSVKTESIEERDVGSDEESSERLVQESDDESERSVDIAPKR